MKKVALLIGVSEYEPGLTPLPGALKDIEALQQVLVHPEMGGFAETDITVLPNPQRQQMEDAIYDLFANRQKNDLILLFFSGHGVKNDQGKLFLTTRETYKTQRGELRPTSAVRASFVHEQMTNSRSKRQIVILDSCFSGAFAEGMAAKDDGKVDLKAQLGGEGRAVLASSSSVQYSFEQEGEDLSIYTRYLIEGIQTGAADANEDGHISIDELHEYARRKVAEAAPAMTPEIYAVKEGYKIHLANAPMGDPKLEYRKEVERRVQNGKISGIGKRILKRRQEELGLSAEEAKAIQDTVLEPFKKYQASLQEYKEALAEALEEFGGQFDEFTLNELKRFQAMLRLRDEDVRAIEAVVVPQQIREEVSPEISQPVEQKVSTVSVQEPQSTGNLTEDDLSSEKGVDYTKLRDLLKVGQWKDADRETYQIMDQVLNEDWSREALLNFPCKDLLMIDRLWAKYSDDKFGFSVQKKIYADCGANLNGKYPGDKIWYAFCEQVGWRKNRKWVNAKYSTKAPEGHLPGALRELAGYYGVCWGVYLFSCIQTCDDDLSSEQGIDYTKLRNLLKAGQWQEADEETYEVMNQVLDGNWSHHALIKFSCKDLLTIDRLWVKYSDGKFGFSVQQEIYVTCGAKTDENRPGDKVWYAFCTKVGWLKVNEWIAMKFTIKAPKGHLPGLGFGVNTFWGGFRFNSGFFSLASRLAKCNPTTVSQSARREVYASSIREEQNPHDSTGDDLISEQGIDYTKLRNLLKAGQWQEADKETYKVMNQVLDGNSSRDAFLNFPCKDLLTIDRLWVKYSRGKFGFSVQKQIYIACGATIDGTYPDNEIWYAFCETVGWRVNGNWATLKFTLKSHRGHLPCRHSYSLARKNILLFTNQYL
ncbi:MAG: GUN4 domain-containing protein [Cyanobacteria bacterium P01_A01_bin.123]